MSKDSTTKPLSSVAPTFMIVDTTMEARPALVEVGPDAESLDIAATALRRIRRGETRLSTGQALDVDAGRLHLSAYQAADGELQIKTAILEVEDAVEKARFGTSYAQQIVCYVERKRSPTGHVWYRITAEMRQSVILGWDNRSSRRQAVYGVELSPQARGMWQLLPAHDPRLQSGQGSPTMWTNPRAPVVQPSATRRFAGAYVSPDAMPVRPQVAEAKAGLRVEIPQAAVAEPPLSVLPAKAGIPTHLEEMGPLGVAIATPREPHPTADLAPVPGPAGERVVEVGSAVTITKVSSRARTPVTVTSEIIPGLVLTVTILKAGEDSEFDFATAEVGVTLFGRDVPTKLKQKAGQRNFCEISFTLRDGESSRDFKVRLNNLAEEEGQLCLPNNKINPLAQEIIAFRGAEALRVTEALQEAIDHVAEIESLISESLKVLADLYMTMDLPPAIEESRNQILQLESAIQNNYERLLTIAQAYLKSRDAILQAYHLRQQREDDLEGQKQRLQNEKDRLAPRLSRMEGQVNVLRANVAQFRGSSSSFATLFVRYEAAELALRAFDERLHTERTLLDAEMGRLQSDMTMLKRDPAGSAIAGSLLALAALQAEVRSFNQGLEAIEMRLLALNKTAADTLLATTRQREREAQRVQLARSGGSGAADKERRLFSREAAYTVFHREMPQEQALVGLVRDNTRPTLTASALALGIATTSSPDHSRDSSAADNSNTLPLMRVIWGRANRPAAGEIEMDYLILPPIAATFHDIMVAGGQSALGQIRRSMQAIHATMGPTQDVLFLTELPSHNGSSKSKEVLMANYQRRRVYVLWTDTTGIPVVSVCRFCDLPPEIQQQSYINIYPVTTESGGWMSAGLDSDVTDKLGSAGRLRFKASTFADLAVGARASIEFRDGSDAMRPHLAIRHPGDMPVWYVGVVDPEDTDALEIPVHTGVPREEFLSQKMRWFLVREHGGKALLCEHLWDGLPAFIRLAATRQLSFASSLVQIERVVRESGITESSYTSSNSDHLQPDLIIAGRHHPITANWQKSLASLAAYGDNRPRLLETWIHEQGRVRSARIFSQLGRSWADGGGYLVVCSPDPAVLDAFVEINPSGGEKNRLLRVTKNQLPAIYMQLLPRLYFRETSLQIAQADEGFKIQKVFSATTAELGFATVLLKSQSRGEPQRLTHLKSQAWLILVDGTEQPLLPFVQHLEGMDILYFATPDKKFLLRLDYDDGSDAISLFDQHSQLASEVRDLWRRSVTRQEALAHVTHGRTSVRLPPSAALTESVRAPSHQLAPKALVDGAAQAMGMPPLPGLGDGLGLASQLSEPEIVPDLAVGADPESSISAVSEAELARAAALPEMATPPTPAMPFGAPSLVRH